MCGMCGMCGWWLQVLVELCGGDVADAARTGGTQALPNDLKAIMQQQSMLVRLRWGLLRF